MPYLPTFEACVVSSTGCGLGDAVSRVSSLPSPLVWSPRATKVHGDRSVVKCWRSGGRINQGSPVSDGVPVRGGVRWGPASHILLRALEELLGRLFALLGCSPVPSVRPSRVALIAEHTLDDLAGPSGVNGFLLHLFIASGERGLHYFGGDGPGETMEKEVSTLIVPQGVFCKAEQFLE